MSSVKVIDDHVYFGCRSLALDFGKCEEGDVDMVNKPLDARVIQEALDKWLPVVHMLEDIGSQVESTCSFCVYYGECGLGCPLSKDETGVRNCDPFFKLQAALDDCNGFADEIVGVLRESERKRIEEVHDKEVLAKRLEKARAEAKKAEIRACKHHGDVEVTLRGDRARFFTCTDCGRHRTEPF